MLILGLDHTRGIVFKVVCWSNNKEKTGVDFNIRHYVDIDYTYDQLMRITSKESVNSNSVMIAGYTAGYDMAGNRLYEAHAHDGGKGEVYKYDSLYRLTNIAFGVSNPANEVEEASPTTFTTRTSYSFDRVNNWTTKSTFTDQADLAINTNDTYAINDLNQYAQISKSIDGGAPTDESLVYDEAGNLIGDGEKLYVYDDRNLLTEVRDADDNALIARYAYDALKRRISKEKANGTIIDYIYDGWQVVEERISDVVTVNYIYNDGIDDPIAMIAGSDVYYYDTDLRHNISTMTDASGDVIERYSYDAYGEVKIEDAQGVAIAQSAIGNAYLFSSRRYDVDTGLYYYRNRIYSPSLGRFMQRDPIWYEDGLNLYAYVGGNPVRCYDPWGLLKRLKNPDAYIERLENAVINMDLKELGNISKDMSRELGLNVTVTGAGSFHLKGLGWSASVSADVDGNIAGSAALGVGIGSGVSVSAGGKLGDAGPLFIRASVAGGVGVFGGDADVAFGIEGVEGSAGAGWGIGGGASLTIGGSVTSDWFE